jgi:hypothetical protein
LSARRGQPVSDLPDPASYRVQTVADDFERMARFIRTSITPNELAAFNALTLTMNPGYRVMTLTPVLLAIMPPDRTHHRNDLI